MIFDIKISEQADEDLREIFEYIAVQLKSPENAMAQIKRLEKSILSLEQLLVHYSC